MPAGLDIGNFACGSNAVGRDVDTQISTVATAAAEAIAEIRATCVVQGSGSISTEGSAMATARAEEYGRAVSDLFAGRDLCPRCTAVADAVVRTSEQIISEATASVWFQVTLRTSACPSVALSQHLCSHMAGWLTTSPPPPPPHLDESVPIRSSTLWFLACITS